MRVNSRIKVSPVRLIGPGGEQFGILPVNEAQARASEMGMDLVEVSPNTRPTVCRIMDYGKYKYELAKKDKLAKKKQHSFQMKEMRFRPKIDEHDYQFKAKHIRQFLESGNKVKAFVILRGREMAHKDIGQRILDRVIEDLADIANVDALPKQERNRINLILSPKPEVVKKMQAEKEEVRRSKSEREKVSTGDVNE